VLHSIADLDLEAALNAFVRWSIFVTVVVTGFQVELGVAMPQTKTGVSTDCTTGSVVPVACLCEAGLI
jgi:hypothetical protein